jgi:hypothetical protein
MSRRSGDNILTLLPKPPVLITESADEFDTLHKALEQDIKPRGVIEHLYVADISFIMWEILRLRRCKAVIINVALQPALKVLLTEFLRKNDYADFVEDNADNVARKWFTDQRIKKILSELLGQFQLDESAIEAEAIRRSSADLELIDRMLASLESRRNKALRCIGEYRDSLARQLRESTDRIIDGKDVLRLEHASGKRSSAA